MCEDPAPAWRVCMCAACNSRSLNSSEETLLDIEPKVTARYRSKGYNGSNSHPRAGLSWPLAYPYSPMLPSVLAVVNVEGAHTGTTTDPLKNDATAATRAFKTKMILCKTKM